MLVLLVLDCLCCSSSRRIEVILKNESGIYNLFRLDVVNIRQSQDISKKHNTEWAIIRNQSLGTERNLGFRPLPCQRGPHDPGGTIRADLGSMYILTIATNVLRSVLHNCSLLFVASDPSAPAGSPCMASPLKKCSAASWYAPRFKQATPTLYTARVYPGRSFNASR